MDVAAPPTLGRLVRPLPSPTNEFAVIVCDAVRFDTLIVPAAKSPLMSLATNVFPVLVNVPPTATDEIVTAEDPL